MLRLKNDCYHVLCSRQCRSVSFRTSAWLRLYGLHDTIVINGNIMRVMSMRRLSHALQCRFPLTRQCFYWMGRVNPLHANIALGFYSPAKAYMGAAILRRSTIIWSKYGCCSNMHVWQQYYSTGYKWRFASACFRTCQHAACGMHAAQSQVALNSWPQVNIESSNCMHICCGRRVIMNA